MCLVTWLGLVRKNLLRRPVRTLLTAAGVFGWGLAFALAVGVAGAIYPTWRALRLSPIEALRRE
jgi:hypothetical protein